MAFENQLIASVSILATEKTCHTWKESQKMWHYLKSANFFPREKKKWTWFFLVLWLSKATKSSKLSFSLLDQQKHCCLYPAEPKQINNLTIRGQWETTKLTWHNKSHKFLTLFSIHGHFYPTNGIMIWHLI